MSIPPPRALPFSGQLGLGHNTDVLSARRVRCASLCCGPFCASSPRSGYPPSPAASPPSSPPVTMLGAGAGCPLLGPAEGSRAPVPPPLLQQPQQQLLLQQKRNPPMSAGKGGLRAYVESVH